MITMEQLEQLEGRILKALELISDLRLENNHLESEVERLKSANDQLKLVAEEKINHAASMQRDLESAKAELERLRGKEVGLEEKLTEIIARLDDVKTAKPAAASTKSKAATAAAVKSSAPAPAAEPAPEIVNLDDAGEDEIVLLEDEEDEEVIIMDEEPDAPAETKEPSGSTSDTAAGSISLKEHAKPEASEDDFVIDEDDEDVLGVFQDEDDDELLIIDDEKN